MDTMALDTNRSTTGGAVRGGYARSREACMRNIRCLGLFRGPPEAGKGVRTGRLRPFAHTRSPRDNRHYRASFAL